MEVGLLFAGIHKNWFNSRCWWYLYNAKNNGKSQSNGCIIIADKITADQADRWGLIWEAVPDESFEKVWLARANHLANGPTVAYGYLKDALKSSLIMTLIVSCHLKQSYKTIVVILEISRRRFGFSTEERGQIRRAIIDI